MTISLINLLIRTLAFSFKMPSVHAADYFQVVDNFGCPEGLMRAVEQSAGGKLFHHVVESDKVAAGILKEVNRIKLEERRVAATEELEKKTTKALEDFESEEKRLSGIVAQEEAEVHKLLESAVRLRINYSKLVQQ